MRGLIVLRWWVHLPVVPRCPGIFPSCGSSSTGGGILCVVRGSYGPVDVEAFPCRIIAVGFRIRVWLGGVETSALLLRRLLSERGEGVSPKSQASRPAYLGKT